jgi:putative transposase
MSKRRTHSSEFKAKVAMEAISSRKTILEIAADHASHPIQVRQWKKRLLEGTSELFCQGQTEQGQGGRASPGGRAFPADRAIADGAGVAQKNLNCSGARELGTLVDHDNPDLSISRQWELLGLPRSTLYDRAAPVRESTL